MKLGTVVYNNEIYNLDYMTTDEIKKLLDIIEKEKNNGFAKAKKILKD